MMKMKRSLSAFFILFAILFADGPGAQETCPPLKICVDPVLQKGLERCVARLDMDGAVKARKLSVALVDITTPAAPRMAALNGDTMMYAASLPKIAILLGAFDRIQKGELPFDGETKKTLTRMIRNSSNSCATKMLNRVGKDYLADLLQSRRYRLYDPEFNGGLWVGKEYGKSPAFRRDPMYNLSHGATAIQTARFYYMLETGRLVSPELSRQMKEILGKPAICHKFVKGLTTARPGSRIFRKSGTWRTYHADSAIVERDGRRYIAVALANTKAGGQWFPRLIVGLDDLIFKPERYATLSTSLNDERIR
jgi:beta-lactamase class A